MRDGVYVPSPSRHFHTTATPPSPRRYITIAHPRYMRLKRSGLAHSTPHVECSISRSCATADRQDRPGAVGAEGHHEGTAAPGAAARPGRSTPLSHPGWSRCHQTVGRTRSPDPRPLIFRLSVRSLSVVQVAHAERHRATYHRRVCTKPCRPNTTHHALLSPHHAPTTTHHALLSPHHAPTTTYHALLSAHEPQHPPLSNRAGRPAAPKRRRHG